MSTPQICVSQNYDQFKFVHFNRAVNKTNLKKIRKEYEKEDNFRYFPILVDNNLNIIDGQHRFTVCKELGLPIYYIVKPKNATADDIKTVNIAGRRHNKNDYLEMECKLGNTEALYLKSLPLNFEGISIEAAFIICNSDSGRVLVNAQRGKFVTRDFKEVEDFCRVLLSIVNGAVKSTVPSIFAHLENKTDFTRLDIARELYRKGLLIESSWPRPVMLNRIVQAYNHGKTENNRIRGVI